MKLSEVPSSWAIVHVHNQDEADKLIPDLLRCEAEKRIVVIELEGAVDLTKIRRRNEQGYMFSANALSGLWYREKHRRESQDDYLSSLPASQERLPGLNWVILRGSLEALSPDWIRSLRDQCQEAGVPLWCAGQGECGLPSDHYEKITLTFQQNSEARREGPSEFIENLLLRHDAGKLHIPLQGMVVWKEMARNTADHTQCSEALFMYSQHGEQGSFLYLDEGGGPEQPIEWCIAEGNSTGDENKNSGLGLPFILKHASKPFNMHVQIIRFGNAFGYIGNWPLERTEKKDI